MQRVEEMETKILSSIDDIKNEMTGIKTEQNEMKKQISTIEQVFLIWILIWSKLFRGISILHFF